MNLAGRLASEVSQPCYQVLDSEERRWLCSTIAAMTTPSLRYTSTNLAPSALREANVVDGNSASVRWQAIVELAHRNLTYTSHKVVQRHTR